MKSIIQEVHEGLSEDERGEMERLAARRGVCTCALLKGWLAAAFRRLEAKRLVGQEVDEASACPRCSPGAVTGATGAATVEAVPCVAALDEGAVQPLMTKTF